MSNHDVRMSLDYFLNQKYFVLILIIFTASMLRIWDLGNIGFNSDEAVYSGQSATLAGFDEFTKHFSIYRAHPLLLQSIISTFFVSFGVIDIVARIVSAIFGILTIIVVYFIGKQLFNKKIAVVATLIIAIIPYHIIISRQVLLDGALSFFLILTLYFMIRYVNNKNSYWLYLVGASSGLSFLSKEVGIFVLISSTFSLLLTKNFTSRGTLIIISSFLLATSPYWIPILSTEDARQSALSYWQWQTSRDQNLPDTFYLTVIIQNALGYVLTGLVIISIIFLVKTKEIKKPKVTILLVWIAVPLLIFNLIPVKGYHFVITLVPTFILLGVSILDSLWLKKVSHYGLLVISLIALIFFTSGPVLDYLLHNDPEFYAGSGGEPHIREAALWIGDNVPNNQTFLTADARTANIIKFYANNEALSLHSNRNPAYIDLGNPDLHILNDQIQYLVLQPHIADRFPYLTEEVRLIHKLIIKHGAVPIHIENETYAGVNGEILNRHAIIIYSLDDIRGN